MGDRLWFEIDSLVNTIVTEGIPQSSNYVPLLSVLKETDKKLC